MARHSSDLVHGTLDLLMLRSLALRVPSVIVKAGNNVVIKPHHPDFRHLVVDSIEAFAFDRRLLR